MLPYGSIEEVRAALGGRELTWLESWWFRTTADVSDDVIFRWSAAVIMITIHIAGLALLAVENGVLVGPKFAARYKIQPSVRLDWPTVRRVYISSMAMYVGIILPMVLMSYPIFKIAGMRTSLPLPSVWEVVAQVVVYFLIEDFCNYWIHRWLHSPWMYYNVHAVHHSIKAPGYFVGIYTHPLESVLEGIPALLGAFIVPPHVVTFWIWIMVATFHGFEVHSGYDFPTPAKLLVPFWGGAEFHDHHHLYGDQPKASNFGVVLTIFDYIYGTDKAYHYLKRAKESKRLREENIHLKDM